MTGGGGEFLGGCGGSPEFGEAETLKECSPVTYRCKKSRKNGVAEAHGANKR